jgi:tRNA-Thr(GGU) m(6)t(6)A37 methyltransferase TsaA
MKRTRRKFLARAAELTAGGALLAPTGMARAGEAPDRNDAEVSFQLTPVGKVEKKGDEARILIFDRYGEALLGLEGWSHVNVFWWFDKSDVPEKRRILRVHPRGDDRNPLTGVFACRAPVRPNLIALSVCKILSVDKNVVRVDTIDAFDGTPVLDLKPFIPPDAPVQEIKVPDWAKRKQ